MSSGERPMGAAKGKQSDTEALCQPPPPPVSLPAALLTSRVCTTLWRTHVGHFSERPACAAATITSVFSNPEGGGRFGIEEDATRPSVAARVVTMLHGRFFPFVVMLCCSTAGGGWSAVPEVPVDQGVGVAQDHHPL